MVAANGVSRTIARAGADFKREFAPASYERFFKEAGYENGSHTLCPGRTLCAVAVLPKKESARQNRSTEEED